MRISDWSSDVCSSDLSTRAFACASSPAMNTSNGRPCNEPAARTWENKVLNALTITALAGARSEEHTSELQSLMRISYAVFCLKKKKKITQSHIIDILVNIDSTTRH